jgi:hypothetical protein
LASTRLRVMTKPLRNSADYIRSARETRLAMDFVMGDLLESDPTLSAYPYSLFYVYYDQYGYIRSVAIENMLLGIAVVFLAVTIIQEIKVALVICGIVLLITIDLIGFVWFTNLFTDHGFVIEINAISVNISLFRSSILSPVLVFRSNLRLMSASPCSSSRELRMKS